MVSVTIPIELLYGMYWIVGSILTLELLFVPLRKKQISWMISGMLIPFVQVICIYFAYDYVSTIIYPFFWMIGLITSFLVLYLPMKQKKISWIIFSFLIPSVLLLIVYLIFAVSVPSLL